MQQNFISITALILCRLVYAFYWHDHVVCLSVCLSVAKRYILQQKCPKGQIETCLLGTRWCNF